MAENVRFLPPQVFNKIHLIYAVLGRVSDKIYCGEAWRIEQVQRNTFWLNLNWLLYVFVYFFDKAAPNSLCLHENAIKPHTKRKLSLKKFSASAILPQTYKLLNRLKPYLNTYTIFCLQWMSEWRCTFRLYWVNSLLSLLFSWSKEETSSLTLSWLIARSRFGQGNKYVLIINCPVLFIYDILRSYVQTTFDFGILRYNIQFWMYDVNNCVFYVDDIIIIF